jgi:hypothetical protein
VDLSTVIANWQTKLLQLDRRNSLLYFKEKSSISFKGETVDGLTDRLQQTRKGLAFPYPEHRRGTKDPNPFDAQPEEPVVVITPGDVETEEALLPLQRLLSALHRRDREWEEEPGLMTRATDLPPS